MSYRLSELLLFSIHDAGRPVVIFDRPGDGPLSMAGWPRVPFRAATLQSVAAARRLHRGHHPSLVMLFHPFFPCCRSAALEPAPAAHLPPDHEEVPYVATSDSVARASALQPQSLLSDQRWIVCVWLESDAPAV